MDPFRACLGVPIGMLGPKFALMPRQVCVGLLSHTIVPLRAIHCWNSPQARLALPRQSPSSAQAQTISDLAVKFEHPQLLSFRTW